MAARFTSFYVKAWCGRKYAHRFNLNSLISKAIFRLRKKKVVVNALRSEGAPEVPVGRVFLYYKTDPLFSKKLRDSYRHTNNSEILEIIRTFNQLGFCVDVIDRDASWDDIKPLLVQEYSVYFANAAGNSAPLHAHISKEIDAKCRVYYAAGPEPGYSNELVHRRHDEFDERTGCICVRRRVLKDANFQERLSNIDAIFYIGNEFSASTFRRVVPIPSFPIVPSTSSLLSMDMYDLQKKSAKSFLYLGGNGLICKGLDLVLEAFDGLHDLTLDVCAPSDEADFWKYYRPLLKRNPQIRFHGFVDVTGKLFREITARTAFNVFPSCSEGCATSVVTAMRRGVIPVVTHEVGVDVDSFGYELNDATVNGIRNVVVDLSGLPQKELKRRVVAAYLESGRYSIEGFRNSLSHAVLNTLIVKGLL